MDAEGEITAIQDDLVHKTASVREQTEAQRRDLEGLKRLDLLQEQRYRELRDFEDRLRGRCRPPVFEAGMGAEAVQKLLIRHRPGRAGGGAARRDSHSTTGQRRKKATKRLQRGRGVPQVAATAPSG